MEGNCFENSLIKLVDFGYVTQYLDEQGMHNKKKKIKEFKGNIIFSSIHQMKFKSTSRRDDLI